MNKRRLKIGFASLIGAVTLGLTITAVSSNGGFAFSRTDGGLYSITLNSTNKVTSNGDHLMYTANGGEVTFTYTNTSRHVSLLDGGTVTNKDRITSINTFSCSYSGSGYLTFKTSLDNSTWSAESDAIASEQEYTINSHPYYLALTAHGSVTILSARYTFTCIPNSSSSEYTKVTSDDDLTDGEYLIVYEAGSVAFDGSLDTLDATDNTIAVTIENNAITATDEIDASAFTIDMTDGTIQSASGYYIGATSNSNSLNTSKETAYTNSISVNEDEATIESSGGAYLRYNAASNQNRFRYYKSSSYTGQKAIHLYKKGGSSTPASEITKITVKSSKTTFNTKDKLEDYLNGITVDIEYDDSTKNVNNVAYADLSTYKLTLTLLNPSGTSYETSTAFGTSGNWTIRVSDKDDNIHGDVAIIVEAIPVSSITIGGTLTVEAGKTTQLTATVSPDYADNPSVTWESDDTSVATVSTTGLVTGVAVGTAKITATATDGRAKYGEVTIEVTEATVVDDEGVFELLQSGAPAIGDYVVIASGTSGSVYAMSSEQKTSNRAGISTTVTNSTITRDSNSEFAAFEIQEGSAEGTYAFYDHLNEGYLYAASSTANQLKLESTISSNSSFTISGTTIQANGTNSRKLMRYNPNNGSPLFACYATNTNVGNGPSIYVKQGQKVYANSIDISGPDSTSTGSTENYSVSYTPENTNVRNVTWTSSTTGVATIEDGVLTAVSAGTTTITASVPGENSTTIKATKKVTVSDVAVTGISLNKSTLTLEIDETSTLIETVLPTNATNKAVTWTSSDSAVASVTSGVVKGKSAGGATITATTADGGFVATCKVTVNAASGGDTPVGGSDTLTREITGVSGTSYSEWSGKTGESGAVYAGQSAGDHDSIQLRSNNSNSGIVTTTSGGIIASVTIDWNSNTASGRTVNVYGSHSAYTAASNLYASGTQGTLLGTIVYGTSTSLEISSGDYEYVGVRSASGALYMNSITFVWGSSEPIYPTAITFKDSDMELGLGKSTTLGVSFTPSNANQNKTLTWSSSNSSVVAVSNGTITAKAIGTATITASTKNQSNATISDSIKITVVETALDKWTIMIYMCGSDLETDNSLATSDLKEILSVSGQPSDINIIVETGGAKTWHMTNPTVSSTKLERWHIRDQQMIKDDSLAIASMEKQSTFQSFLEWGLTEYPAEKTGVIMWDHGGAMMGVCCDEKYEYEGITDDVVIAAVDGAFSKVGKTDNLEWIGYDACLMGVQDIADLNSQRFNYMVASEELESGYGWDYDNWLDNLYAYNDTESVLTEICTSFINDGRKSSDETLAWYDLSKAEAYRTAWENMALQLKSKLSDSNKSSFISLVKSCKTYGSDDYNDDYMDYCVFDAKDFVNKLAANSTFKPDASYTNAVLTAHSNLVKCSKKGSSAGNSYGITMFFPAGGYTGMSYYYTTAMTRFTNWRYLCTTYKGSNS